MCLNVAAGILQDDAGRVLIAQRPPGKHMAGAWEFPGGKIAAGETALQGLVRELREELAVTVTYARYLIRYSHDYPEHRVCLNVWKVLGWEAVPRSCEGQALQWLPPSELMGAGLLPADEPIAQLLQADAPANKVAPLLRFISA